MQERSLIDLNASDARQRYTRLGDDFDVDALADQLTQRFADREHADIERTGMVLDLVTHDGCQTNALVGYFGEQRAAPCGHCTFCVTGKPQVLPTPQSPDPLSDSFLAEIDAVRRAHPDALGEARQAARFLCGLSSPALTRAKLTRHPLFGRLETHRFTDVLSLL